MSAPRLLCFFIPIPSYLQSTARSANILITQMIYIPYIYVNEFDHHILALLKQGRERPENSGLNGNSNNNFLSFIFFYSKTGGGKNRFL